MSKRIFLILTILTAVIFGIPHLNFQENLSQGDIGRDLYAFEQVMHGKMVYQDIWWVYGPLMPYYYGLFFSVFGLKISSILFGKIALSVLGSLFFYLACAEVMPFCWAFIAAFYFLQSQQDFFFTYNHIGGLVLSIGVFWLILKHFNKENLRLGFWALGVCFIIGLIKVNFGATALLETLICFAVIDGLNFYRSKKLLNSQAKLFYICGLVVIPVLWLIIYAILLNGLPNYEIRQCMPYMGEDHPYNRSPWIIIPYYLTQHWLSFYHGCAGFFGLISQAISQTPNLLNPIVLVLMTMTIGNFLIHPIVHGSTIAGFIFSFSKKFDEKRQKFWLIQMALWLFFILNFHEFFVTGIWYRTYWSQPFLTFFSFLMIVTATSFTPRWLRRSIFTFWLIFCLLTTFVLFMFIKSCCAPDKFLRIPRGQIYVGNNAGWVDTVNTVTEYLNTNLKQNELFFALPYDCLYYYTTGKPSPSRQLIFFDHINIPPAQEISIIKELESKRVNYVLMSNRIITNELGMGIFGKTYCPILFQYITQNFTPIYRYGGNWQADPLNTENHGVMILKRK